jgi:ribosome-associated translation inhibitor RaiA
MTFSERLKLVFSKIWDFLAPFVKVFLSSAGNILAASAITAVKTVAQTMGEADGAAKRKAAFTTIVTALKGQGITLGVQVTTSMIYAAIEAAVQKLKTEE